MKTGNSVENIKEIIEELYNSDISLGTKRELTENLGSPEDVAEACKELHDKKLYDKIKSLPIMPLSTLWKIPSLKNDYIIENLVWKGQSIMWMAKDKVGKSITTMQAACAMTTGTPFLDILDVSGKYNVVYIQTEGSMDESKNRTISMSKAVKVDPDKFFYMYKIGLALHTDEGLNELIEAIQSLNVKVDVIILDCLYMAVTGGNIIELKDATNLCVNMTRLKLAFDATLIAVHHKKKSGKDQNGKFIDGGDEEFVGSFALKAYFDHTINMRQHSDDTRTLKCETQRNGNVMKSITLELKENPLHFVCKCGKASDGQQGEAYTWIKRKKMVCAKDIAKHMNVTDSKARGIISSLYKKNLIRKLGEVGDGRNVYYEVVK